MVYAVLFFMRFSETATPMRHYNADACRVIAEMALAALGPILE